MYHNLPETTIAWLSALIDGEGSVMLISRSPSPAQIEKSPSVTKYNHYRAQVGIYNTDIRLMEALTNKTGISRIYTHTRQAKENHKKTAYRWNLVADECRIILPQLLPWLVLKKEQSELLLQALKIKDKLTTKKGEMWLSPNEVSVLRVELDLIHDQITYLNRKGRETSVE